MRTCAIRSRLSRPGPGTDEYALTEHYDRWRDDLRGFDRLRVIVNAMTRIRFCRADGKMQFDAKGKEPPRGKHQEPDQRDQPGHVSDHEGRSRKSLKRWVNWCCPSVNTFQ